MAKIGQLETNNVSSVQMPELNAAAPMDAGGAAYRAEAAYTQTLKSIFELGDRAYQREAAIAKEAERRIKSANASAEAHTTMQAATEQAKTFEDTDAIVPYLQKVGQDYLEAQYKRYEDDPELQAAVFESTQRAVLVAQDSGFNYANQKKKEQLIGATENSLYAMRSSFLMAGSEAARKEILLSGGDAINGAVAAGAIGYDDGERLKRSFISDNYAALINREIINGNTATARGYLKATSTLLEPEKQNALLNSITAEESRQEVKLERMAREAELNEIKKQTMFIKDPASYAIKYQGADPNNPQDIAQKTGFRAVMGELDAQVVSSQINATAGKPEQMVGMLSELRNKYGDYYELALQNLHQYGKIDENVSIMLDIAEAGNSPAGNTNYPLLQVLSTYITNPEQAQKDVDTLTSIDKKTLGQNINQRIDSRLGAAFRDGQMSEVYRASLVRAMQTAAYGMAARNPADDENAVIEKTLGWIDNRYRRGSAGTKAYLIPKAALQGEDLSQQVDVGLRLILQEQKALLSKDAKNPHMLDHISYVNNFGNHLSESHVMMVYGGDGISPVRDKDGNPINISFKDAAIRGQKWMESQKKTQEKDNQEQEDLMNLRLLIK